MRALLSVTGLGLTALALTACTGASTPRQPAAAGGSTASTPPATPRASASSQPASRSPSATRSAAAPDDTGSPATERGDGCQFAQLRVSTGKAFAAAGNSGLPLLFRNVSGRTCQLYGYPGVAGLDAAGRQVTEAKRNLSGMLGGVGGGWPGGMTIPVVTLAPGQVASAMVEGTDNPQGNETSCPRLAGLLVTPPNTYHSTRLPIAPADCSGLAVHPVVPGTAGHYPDH